MPTDGTAIEIAANTYSNAKTDCASNAIESIGKLIELTIERVTVHALEKKNYAAGETRSAISSTLLTAVSMNYGIIAAAGTTIVE